MKILIAGDFCPQCRVSELIVNNDYAAVFSNVRSDIEAADYSIVNFECPVCSGREKPIDKCGPNLCCNEKGLEAIKWAGFDCVTLANNHFFDYGEKGVKNTLAVCKKYDIDVVGGGTNIREASQILYKVINGRTIAVINCCEHEFSIATETSPGSNPLDPVQQYYAIKKARVKADIVLVIVHGGNEHYQLPSPRMQDTYRFFVDAGADAVINHHQHCYSGYEIYREKPIFYGLGNFCFDNENKRQSKWNEGFILKLSFADNVKFEIIPYIQCDNTPNVVKVSEDYFEESISKLNKIISDENGLSNRYYEYINENSDLRKVFSPYSNRILDKLCAFHLLPSSIGKEKRRLMLAYIQCESHFPKVINFLKR